MNTVVKAGFMAERFNGKLQRYGGALVNLGLRWFVGWQFFKSGLLKISDWGNTLSMFHDVYHTPLLAPNVAAALGAFGELTFPALLFVGFLSRPAALGLFFVNAVAVISYPDLFHFDCPAAIQSHLYWGISLLVLLVWGPGGLSLDHWLKHSRSGK
ncbi:DoxX family protein [Burkholderia glumae]|nr:DoxD family protein [Burkholderia glumae BGR1]AJY62326.1 doxX family protein [Burkholderia glumae LMG 2196 = ATCC 33617]KHJ64956.1 membrane protein [Burkholderia glumae]NVE26252.1 DoxX family protein [Burkholderia glumae]PNK93280.1 DoxX family protein [Burkholderia glumae]